MADTQILQVIWAETGALTALDGTKATAQRLRAIVGRLVAQAALAGELGVFALPARLPAIGEPGHDIAAAMQDVVGQAADSGQLNGAKLPLRAVLWEISPDGAPRNAEPALPPGSSWVPRESTRQSDFKAPDGRYFRLYESDAIALPGSAAWVSGYTRSGILKPIAATMRADTRLAWVIGIAATIVFVLGGGLSVWSGRSMSTARNILAANNVVVQNALLLSFANVCAEDYKAFPEGTEAALCANVLGPDHQPPALNAATGEVAWPDRDKALKVLAEARTCPANPERDGCNAIWRAAVALDQAYSGSTGFFAFGNKVSAYLTGTDAVGGSTSIVLPFLMLLVGVGALIIALGLGTKQRVAGVWIDTRNRVSLARAQVTLWTIVALAGYAALALFNVGFSSIVGSDAIAAFKPFPSIPSSVAAALGIAFASPMISALILATKDSKNGELAVRGDITDLRRRGVPFFGAESEGLDKRSSPMFASIADIFMGEEKADADTVDVSRLQNVVITLTLVLGYFCFLVQMMGHVLAKDMLGAKAAIFSSMPDMGSTFASLLFISHAAYLVSKAHDSQSGKPEEVSPKH